MLLPIVFYTSIYHCKEMDRWTSVCRKDPSAHILSRSIEVVFVTIGQTFFFRFYLQIKKFHNSTSNTKHNFNFYANGYFVVFHYTNTC